MAIVNPISDAYEALLITSTTSSTTAVFPSTEPNFEVDLDALLTKTTSKLATKPLVEMEHLLSEAHDSLFGESDDVEEGSKADKLEELSTRSHHTHATAVYHAVSTEDAFQSYLRDIRGLDPLTHAEEIDLARQVDAGDERARRKLIESNLRLVIAIARRYMSTGVPLVDLIQEGNLGLMRAAEKFDYRRGCRFGTYATWWIRQAVSQAASEQSHLIHLPEHVATHLRRVRRVKAQLSQANGLAPLPDQIAEACHIKLDEVKKLLDIVEQPVSLDIAVDDEVRSSFADTLEDNTAPALTETVSQHLLSEELHQALTLLTPRERLIIILRYGIGDGSSRTLLEVGKELGISRERVRQLEARALKKMRSQI